MNHKLVICHSSGRILQNKVFSNYKGTLEHLQLWPNWPWPNSCKVSITKAFGVHNHNNYLSNKRNIYCKFPWCQYMKVYHFVTIHDCDHWTSVVFVKMAPIKYSTIPRTKNYSKGFVWYVKILKHTYPLLELIITHDTHALLCSDRLILIAPEQVKGDLIL